MIGTILGNRYRVLRDIGSGGMARVYLAEDMNEGQLVAVKVLYPHFGEDISYIQRFSREAKLAEALENEHVVRVLDYGSSRDIHYIVMEYVQGRDLRTLLNERGPLAWEEALEMIDQVCEALEEANRHNIVHRDVKPQNVMMTDGGALKVLDFGIARSRMLPSLTQSGFVGSPYYISPEQAMGEEVDIRSDIYSTGIVLYELLSGRVPFDAKSPWSIISQHIASEPPQIEVDEQRAPEPVQKLLKRMIAKNAADRFQSPTIVRQAIGAILAGRDLPPDLGTPPPTNTDRVAMADSLYRRAVEALEKEQWQKAVNLLNQALDLDPDHANALKKRTEAGTQARLKALHLAASRAMENQRWQEAIDELTEILEIDADYKDSVKMLVQARDAIEKQNVNVGLSELYDKAIAHFEAEEYDQAEQLFGQIRKVSPLYRRADALWAESRRRKAKEGGFARLNQNLATTQMGSRNRPLMKRPQVHWLAATALIVLSIVVAIGLVSLSSQRSKSEPTADDLFTQAEAAFEVGNLDQARLLVRQALAIDADYAEAIDLQNRIFQLDSLTQQLTDAEAAMAEARWTEGIEALKELHDNQPDFQAERVTTLLCDGYLARGQERIDSVTNLRDQATVRAALTDFRTGQQTCSTRADLGQALAFATNYLEAIAGNSSAAEIIEALTSIVEAEPDYAGGQAVESLYLAYVNQGDLLRTQGDIQGAAAAYNAALNLDVADINTAQTRLNQLPSDSAAQGATPQVTPTGGSATAGPTNTPSQSETAFQYRAPGLVSPEPFANFSGQFTEIVLVWESLNLGSDAYYDVTIRYFVGNEPRYWGGAVTENQWKVPVEAGYGQAGEDKFAWWVTVREVGTDKQLSPSSEERYFFWRPG